MVYERNKDLFNGLLLALIACAVYANSLGNGFVWDDDFVILFNPALKRNLLDVFSSIDTGRSSEVTPYYRPLTMLSFLFEYRIHGLTPFLVRFFNILLHGVNTFLLYRLARVLKINTHGAIIAGLLFAIHPINSEAVNFNAGGRNTMLAAFFILTTCLLHSWCIKNDRISNVFVGVLFFFAGLLSKETTLFILPVIGFLELSYLRSAEQSGRRRAVFRFVPYIVCTLIYLILRNHALTSVGAHMEIVQGLGGRLLDNLYIIPRYLLSIVWPKAISVKYFVPEYFSQVLSSLVIAWLIIISMVGWLFTRLRTQATLFGITWLIIFWIPVSGIFPIPSAPLADRYLYVPLMGLWLIVGDRLSPLLLGYISVRRVTIIVLCVVGLFLTILTTKRNLEWKSDITLFSKLIEKYPNRAFGYHNLGCAWLDKGGNLYLAEQAFEKALTLEPAFPRLRTQLGYVHMLRQDYLGALQQYAEAVIVNPFDAEAHLNTGIAFEKLGRFDEALVAYQRFIDTPGGELPEARIATRQKIINLLQLLGTKNAVVK